MECSKVQQLFEQYVAGTLAENQKIAMDEHLDGCDACPLRLEEYLMSHGQAMPPEEEAELMRLLRVPLPQITLVESGVAQVLRKVKAQSETEQQKGDTRIWSFWRRPIAAFAYSAIIVVLVAFAVWQNVQYRAIQREIADAQTLVKDLLAQNQQLQQNLQQANAQVERLQVETAVLRSDVARLQAHLPHGSLAVALRDGDKWVMVDTAGNMAGLEALPPALRNDVVRALRERRLAVAPELQHLSTAKGRLMGTPHDGQQFAVISPVGVVVVDNRPVFRWRELAGASHYQVAVLDTEYRPILTSPRLADTEWMPAQPLPRGKIYTWYVVAYRDGQEVQTPKPPDAEARFRVLGQKEAEELLHLRQKYATSPLVLSVIYARYGLVEEARQQLRVLQQQNTHSPSVSSLLTQLQASLEK